MPLLVVKRCIFSFLLSGLTKGHKKGVNGLIQGIKPDILTEKATAIVYKSVNLSVYGAWSSI
jgi:hypothetical protein